jgi:pilus assembly protein CpaC
MPGLGEVPVLGQLFNSQEFVSGETELVILVTPRLAKPIDRSAVTLPTDAFVSPNDLQYYLLGRSAYIAEPSDDDEQAPRQSAPQTVPVEGGSEGSFGHEL